MRILVVENDPKHQQSARETLADHDLTIATSIGEAWKMELGAFDAVLTDLYLPTANIPFQCCLPSEKGPDGEWYTPGWVTKYHPWEGSPCSTEEKVSSEIPAGLVFALTAANIGVRTLILTDTDHHRDVLVGLLDLLVRSDGKKIAVPDCRECKRVLPEKGWAKDWRLAMFLSRLFPEIPRPKDAPDWA
ncbi:MAG: hypothetical protein ACD_50C00345G0003 [uncultured bacterium]|nr:MAG: hypothetical protein ACD_50C00345G0003 [uncultured bacterium]